MTRAAALYIAVRTAAALAAALAVIPAFHLIAGSLAPALAQAPWLGVPASGLLAVLGPVLVAAMVMAGWAQQAYTLAGIAVGVAGVLGLGPLGPAVSLLASSALYTLSLRYSLEAEGAASRRLECGRRCVAATAVSLLAGYTLLVPLSVYGGLLASSVYRYLLSPRPGLPEPLAGVWSTARGMLAVRAAVLAVLVYVLYYAVERLAAPMVYALAAAPEELSRSLERLLEQEARETLAMRKWYHRMLRCGLSAAGAAPAAAIGYLAAHAAQPLASRLPQAAPWWAAALARTLPGLAASTPGYLAARRLLEALATGRIEWRRLALGSAAALAALLAAYMLLLIHQGAGVHGALQRLLGAAAGTATGREPPPLPGEDMLASAARELDRLLGRDLDRAEYILRLLSELLWG
ncbi:hypothetical protein CF15_01185 [Pyrodictium occultum]|uniref:Uncharacterized protein n=1 Tax=Pyrodictium occultum TaxID=2309 RepID=A0A0V8RTV2_PYROC|nr:hypothetical protein [Pyrodictium occultum]KSW11492.1 hypothetical protein CF15_01185 [Pyrodictium occultum]